MRPLWKTLVSCYFRPRVLLFNFLTALVLGCVIFLVEVILILLSDKHFPSDIGLHLSLWMKLSLRTFLACYVGVAIGLLIAEIKYHYLYPKWKLAWSALEEIILKRCYDCRSQEDEQGRRVLVCVPVSEEEQERRVKEYCKEHFGDVSEDTQSEPEKREHRWIQEHPYPKEFVLNPHKSLLVLKSKKGFGVWNTEINAQYKQVSFQKDTVVVQCAFLNPDGSSMSQESEYRIPWKTGMAPGSGLLRKSGEILIRPYDSWNAWPEYIPINSLPVAE